MQLLAQDVDLLRNLIFKRLFTHDHASELIVLLDKSTPWCLVLVNSVVFLVYLFTCSSRKLSLQLLGERWKSRQSLMTEDFSTVEPILALRSSLLHVVSEQPNFSPPSLVAHGVQPGPAAVPGGGQSLILSMLSETMECTARLAREAGQLQVQ